ncbi:MAG: hypothetical protein M3Z66_23115, partial [Chloroflexota bacterium]|nr:hypothetical protein [Chloroflexota bacterium]
MGWKISSGRAKPVKDEPRVEIAWPAQNFQKSRSSPANEARSHPCRLIIAAYFPERVVRQPAPFIIAAAFTRS